MMMHDDAMIACGQPLAFCWSLVSINILSKDIKPHNVLKLIHSKLGVNQHIFLSEASYMCLFKLDI